MVGILEVGVGNDIVVFVTSTFSGEPFSCNSISVGDEKAVEEETPSEKSDSLKAAVDVSPNSVETVNSKDPPFIKPVSFTVRA